MGLDWFISNFKDTEDDDFYGICYRGKYAAHIISECLHDDLAGLCWEDSETVINGEKIPYLSDYRVNLLINLFNFIIKIADDNYCDDTKIVDTLWKEKDLGHETILDLKTDCEQIVSFLSDLFENNDREYGKLYLTTSW